MWNISNLSKEKVMHQHFYVSFPNVFLDVQQWSLLGMGIEEQYYIDTGSFLVSYNTLLNSPTNDAAIGILCCWVILLRLQH